MSTIADVARRAEVAPSTVSRVLNDSGYFSSETRQRVLEAVKELTYVPNIHAERLRTGASKTIAFLVADLANPFWAEVAKGVEDTLWENGYDLILHSTAGDPEREWACISRLRRGQVDGVIVPWLQQGWAELKALDQGQASVVVLGRAPEKYGFDMFAIDNIKGGYLATEHLLRLHHRRIALISADFTRERERGYRMAMEEHGVTLDDGLIFREYAAPELERGKSAVQRFLDQGEMPTAIFAYNDVTAIGTWMELERQGLRVPDDVSLVGFDDISIASVIRTGLTTVALPNRDYGRTAAKFLLNRIAKQRGSSGQCVTMDPCLVKRGSTRSL
ncbi:MAG: LacI family DNA-binding transcriptional regulator [bacterium]